MQMCQFLGTPSGTDHWRFSTKRGTGCWEVVLRGACSWSGGLAHRQVALWLSLTVTRVILAEWRESVAVSGALHTGAWP